MEAKFDSMEAGLDQADLDNVNNSSVIPPVPIRGRKRSKSLKESLKVTDMTTSDLIGAVQEATITSNYERTWNSNKERLLKEWGETALGYAWMHHESSSHFKKLDKKLLFPAIILGAVFSGTGIALTGFGAGPFISLVTYLGTSTGTVLTTIHGQMKYTKRGQLHKEFHSRYITLADTIEEELTKDRRERKNGNLFMADIKRMRKKLLEISPEVPKKVIKRYIELSQGTNLNMPAIAGGLNEISIRRTSNSPSQETDRGGSEEDSESSEKSNDSTKTHKPAELTDRDLRFGSLRGFMREV